MNCLMCELPISAEERKNAERTKDGGFYHKICFDIAVTSLAAQIQMILDPESGHSGFAIEK